MIVTDTQRAVLQSLALSGTLTHPRRSLQRLHKKGLVSGSRRAGFRLTAVGLQMVSGSCASAICLPAPPLRTGIACAAGDTL
jgi:hypothetical protein